MLAFNIGFPSGSAVKNPPAMQEPQETWFWFLGVEDPLEQGMATHSSILTWRIPWTEEPGGLRSIGSKRVRHDWSNLASTHAVFNIFLSDPFFHLQKEIWQIYLKCCIYFFLFYAEFTSLKVCIISSSIILCCDT